jgi:hypothetical protein
MKHKIGDVVEIDGEAYLVVDALYLVDQCRYCDSPYKGDENCERATFISCKEKGLAVKKVDPDKNKYLSFEEPEPDWHDREWAIRQLLDGKTVVDDVGVVIEYRKSHHKPFYYEGEYNEAIEMDCGYRLHQPKKKVKKWMWVYQDSQNAWRITREWLSEKEISEVVEFGKSIQKIEGSMREVEETS